MSHWNDLIMEWTYFEIEDRAFESLPEKEKKEEVGTIYMLHYM